MQVSWHDLLDITSASGSGSRQAKIRRLLTLPAMLLFLAACQSGAPPRPGETLFEQLSGGRFTLHRDITIAPGQVRIIFQEGAAGYGASEYKPRCELEVRDILDTPQAIPAGSYWIGKVRGMQRYVSRPSTSVMLAAVGDTIRLADDTSNEWYMNTYRMQLLNEQQAETAMLVCGGAYNFAFYVRYPTLQEMREALGDYATLSLD